MEKLLSATLSLALAVSLLIGCTPSKTTTSDSSNPQQNNSATGVPVVEGRVTKLVPDETATGELVIATYDEDSLAANSSNNNFDYLTLAVNKFKELYPHVNIVVNRGLNGLDYTQYTKKLSTEIMAGEGPDIFFTSETDLDVNKMISAGVFADMSEFFKNDENFNIADLNQSVFHSGQPDGKQYVVPLFYNIASIITTEKMIEKMGLDLSKFTDYHSILTEFDRIFSKEELSEFLPIWDPSSPPISFPTYLSSNRFNYSTGELVWDPNEAKSLFELVKKHREKYTSSDYTTVRFTDLALKFKSGGVLLQDYNGYTSNVEIAELFTLLTKQEEKPVLLPIKNSTGKMTAMVKDSVGVRSNSNNKQNAYNFIKILIAPEDFPDGAYLSTGIPISNKAFPQVISSYINNRQGTPDDKSQATADEFVKQFTALTNDISDVDWSFYPDRIIRIGMEDYFTGKSDYETCMESVKQKLKIYLTE